MITERMHIKYTRTFNIKLSQQVFYGTLYMYSNVDCLHFKRYERMHICWMEWVFFWSVFKHFHPNRNSNIPVHIDTCTCIFSASIDIKQCEFYS